jgi:Tol biopolymer transport system component
MTMDRSSRVDRVLAGLMDELADARTPDYLEAAIERASSRSQRPGWTFPERWLPMADIASRPAFAPRLPWRTIAVALIITALVIVGTVVFIGSRQNRLPAPFGPAANGLLAYSKDGDIFTVNPVSGVATAVVTGPETDIDPQFSRDGTRLTFLRQDPNNCCMTYFAASASADGSALHVLPKKLAPNATAEFTPDGRSLIVTSGAQPITRYDIAGVSAPVVLGVGRFLRGEIRPPDGAQILFESDSTPDIDLWIVDADGTDAKPLIAGSALQGKQADLAEVRWSPDGTMIAFACAPLDGTEGQRICLTDAAGTSIRTLTTESGAWTETDLAWSPDSRSIAFNRWEQVGAEWVVRPIGVVSVDGGAVRSLGSAPASEGALFDWSPDGKTLLSLPARLAGSPIGAASAKPVSIDVETGAEHESPWEITSNVSWQRVAP